MVVERYEWLGLRGYSLDWRANKGVFEGVIEADVGDVALDDDALAS